MNLDSSWNILLNGEFNKPYFKQIEIFLDEEYKKSIVYPKKEYIFNAFNKCNFDDLKIVILGQDPYHGQSQAHGLSFSVQNGIKIPPSLKNIYKELESDLGISQSNSGNLESWAEQGILLLNSTLTVRQSEPNSHSKIGWQIFTDEVIKKISEEKENIIFVLWGAFAQEKKSFINSNKHFILESSHPSPFSARKSFFGSKVFSKINIILKSIGKKEIDWNLEKTTKLF